MNVADAPLAWHTDPNAAVAEARARHAPILSLRMLGRLDEERSCANSRFFRETVYTCPAVARMLRSRFVLHWHCVRPVPQVRIDLGGGRRIETTIGGNSAHYVLDPDGRPVDCIPGLYDARAFRRALAWAEATALAAAESADRARTLRRLHRRRLEETFVRWAVDLRHADRGAVADAAITTLEATARIDAAIDVLRRGSDASAWNDLARNRRKDVAIDARSRERIRASLPDARIAADLAPTKLAAESRILIQLFASIAKDGVRNEYDLHVRVHLLFASRHAITTAEALDAWVYPRLFAIPLDDPWLGLAPVAYTALERGGLTLDLSA
jgi:hypothetical protein